MDPWLTKKLAGRDVYSVLVDELELSVRAENCLRNIGVRTIADLVTRTEAELMRAPNFGRRTLGEIKDILDTLGLQLGQQVSLTLDQQLDRAMVRARAAKVAYAEAMLEVQRITQLIIETPLDKSEINSA